MFKHIISKSKRMNAQHVKQYQQFISLRLSGLAFWRQTFVPKERVRLRLMVINIHVYWVFLCGPKAKIKTTCNVRALYLPGFQSNEVSKNYFLRISFNLYISKISNTCMTLNIK